MVAWRAANGTPTLSRALTPDERATLEARVAVLRHALAPFDAAKGSKERSLVESHIGAMLGGFMRYKAGEDVGDMVELTLGVLSEFPEWAIREGCLDIARNRVPLESNTWPPSDRQIHHIVGEHVKHYRRGLAELAAILAVKIEPPRSPPPACAYFSRAPLDPHLARTVGAAIHETRQALFDARDTQAKRTRRA